LTECGENRPIEGFRSTRNCVKVLRCDTVLAKRHWIHVLSPRVDRLQHAKCAAAKRLATSILSPELLNDIRYLRDSLLGAA
jgi:hypothetical protein